MKRNSFPLRDEQSTLDDNQIYGKEQKEEKSNLTISRELICRLGAEG